MESIHRVVVGFDHSPSADVALERAFDWASRTDRTEVHLAHVVPVLGDYEGTSVGLETRAPEVVFEEARESVQARAAELLSEWQGRTQRTFQKLGIHIRSGVPSTEILQLAVDLEAELIIVGTHGRRGLRRLLLGSVAESVVRFAKVPVLVVRPVASEEESLVPRIEPACPKCVEKRRETGGAELWCEEHSSGLGRRHTYHYVSRAVAANTAPLVFPTR